MKRNITKMLPILGILAMTGGGTLKADEIHPYSSSENQQPAINPSATVFNEEGCGYSLFAEYLLFKPSSNALILATKGIPIDADKSYKSGANIFPKEQLVSGVRVGGSTSFNQNEWDVNLAFTWLERNEKKMNVLLDNEGDKAVPYNIDRFKAGNENAPYTTSIEGRWKYSFYNLDIEAGRNYFTGQYFAIKPHAGIKIVQTTNELELAAPDISAGVYSDHLKQTFCGIGVKTGLSPTFYLSPSLSMYSDCSFSLPYGKAHVDQTWQGGDNAEGGGVTGNVNTKDPTISPIIETSIGLRYELHLGEHEDYQLLFQAGWEEQIMLNHLHFLMMNNLGTTNNALVQQGLTLRASFSF